MITLKQQIACVRREIKPREIVYRRKIAHGTMHRRKAEHEYAAMLAVLRTLEGLAPDDPQKELF